MKLKYKLLSILVLTSILFSTGVFLLFSKKLQNGFQKIETESAIENTNRAIDSIQNLKNQLLIKQSDWARWDDTYQFIEDHNPEFIKSNLEPLSLVNLNIELMLFVNDKNKIVHSIAVDLDNEKEIPVTNEMLQLADPQNPLMDHPDILGQKSGLVLLKEGPFVVSSQPIITSQSSGPSHGTLIWGFYLNKKVLKQLNNLTHLDFDFFQVKDISPFNNSTENSVVIEPVDENNLIGNALTIPPNSLHSKLEFQPINWLT